MNSPIKYKGHVFMPYTVIGYTVYAYSCNKCKLLVEIFMNEFYQHDDNGITNYFDFEEEVITCNEIIIKNIIE